jgi:hypothetical protein
MVHVTFPVQLEYLIGQHTNRRRAAPQVHPKSG